ncbi:MAG: hypothetical protein ACM34C_01500 [Syntrophaceae bacterium]
MQPVDGQSNNMRVFVVQAFVDKIRTL